MALFHLSVTQTKRSAGQSAIASAAYRAGERLYSEYYGEYSDYTRKGGVICSDILLPSHAPPEYADRQTLWNAVEKAERGKNAQLAYSFDISVEDYEVVCNLIENCPDELPTILTSWYKDQRVDKRSAVVLVNYLSSYGKQYVCSQYISHLFARSLSEISLRTFGKDITSNLNIQ